MTLRSATFVGHGYNAIICRELTSKAACGGDDGAGDDSDDAPRDALYRFVW